MCTYLFAVPTLVFFPFFESGSPVLHSVLLRVLLTTAPIVPALRLYPSDNVHLLQVHLKILPDPTLHLLFWTPATAGLLHPKPVKAVKERKRKLLNSLNNTYVIYLLIFFAVFICLTKYNLFL